MSQLERLSKGISRRQKPSRRTLTVLGLTLGMLLWVRPLAAQQESAPEDDVARESAQFGRIYALVEQNYMDDVDPEQAIQEGAIRGMLATLDPFTSFLNREQFKSLREQTQGHALGFGSILYVTPGKIVVLQTAQNSPSWRAGLGPGDEIVAVNGERVRDLDFRSLVQLLQQSRSHPVTLEVVHPGKVVPETFKLRPAEVALPSVDKVFLFAPGVAYVHVTGFEAKTPQEIADAIERMGGTKLQGLMLDLRDNHGGMIDSAIAVASLFLRPGLSVLTVKGRAEPEKTSTTVAMPVRYELPMEVLVNENTASAAEIVAAALEEHDRALIVGEPTFGKGVVEHIVPLAEETALAITTSQYFTPSGRSIQRPLPGTALADPQQSEGGEKAFKTDDGRPLEAGGGVTPDRLLASWPLDPWERFLDARGLFTSFASDYLTRHGRITRDFTPDATTLDDFRDSLTRAGIQSPDEFWRKDGDYLKLRIKVELLNLVFGLAAGDEAETRGDPLVQKAAALLPQLTDLLRGGAKKSERP